MGTTGPRPDIRSLYVFWGKAYFYFYFLGEVVIILPSGCACSLLV